MSETAKAEKTMRWIGFDVDADNVLTEDLEKAIIEKTIKRMNSKAGTKNVAAVVMEDKGMQHKRNYLFAWDKNDRMHLKIVNVTAYHNSGEGCRIKILFDKEIWKRELDAVTPEIIEYLYKEM